MKNYAAVVVCAVVALLCLAFAVGALISGHYKSALAGVALCLAAIGLGLQEFSDARKFAKFMQRPPFTTTRPFPEQPRREIR